MSNTVPDTAAMSALEGYVDRYGLEQVLLALGVICGDKAAHVRANRQDNLVARKWDNAMARIERVSQSKTVLTVSPGYR